MNIKKDDKVVVLSGKDKGKEGKILSADPKALKVTVEGVIVATKHQKPRRQGQAGGIYQKERAIDASNVMLICPKCGQATRVGHRIVEEERDDGSKKKKVIRVCKRKNCKADID